MLMRKGIVWGLLLALGLLSSSTDCRRPDSPVDYEDAGYVIVDSACSFLQGVTTNQTIIAVCATVEEIAFIATILAPLLAKDTLDGGPVCDPVPNTDLCATPEQMGKAIQALIMRRRRLLLLDPEAGTP
jgi:hypothetical protein